MTQLFSVKAVPDLTGCSARISTLNGVQEGAVLKLRSSNHQFYLHYTPCLTQPTKTIDVSKSFMLANDLEDGPYRLEEVHGVADAKEVKAMVSRQDWEIIGQKSGVLEQQFLGQAKLVWNNVVIPIQHSRSGVVRLKCTCEGAVMRLREHSQVIIDIEESASEPKLVEFQQIKLELDECYGELKQGHNQTIFVPAQLLQHKKLEPNPVYELESAELISSGSLRSFKQYLRSTKEQDDKKHKHPTKWYCKFAQRSENASEMAANCLYSTLTSLPPLLKVKGRYAATQQNLSRTNEYFISAQCKLQVFLIPVRPGFKKSEDWTNRVLDALMVQPESLFINNGIYHCHGQFFYTSVQLMDKQQGNAAAQSISSLLITKVKDYTTLPKLKATFTEAAKKKIFICQPHVYELNVDESERCRINVELAKHRSKQSSDKILDDVCRTFEGLYEDELKRIASILQRHEHLIVSSPNKNGKTFLSVYLRHRQHRKLFYLDFEEISSDSSHRLKDVLEYLELVFQSQRGIIFLDNVDAMCKVVAKDLHRQNEMISSRVLSRRLLQLIELYSEGSCILIAQNHQNLDEEFKQLEATNILLKNPSTQMRRIYFEKLIGEVNTTELLRNTESMNFAQVLGVVLNSSKIAELSKEKERAADQHVLNFLRVAGLRTAKQTILETMEAPFKYSYLYKDLPIKMPKGVLLYGPSGVGKTYLANAVKEQVKISFFEFKGSDILNMYIGASEQAVRDIFETAMSVAPSVVFFDEFESIVPKRNADNSGVTDRIVNQFLCYLDGVSSLEGVFLMAASSRPEMIDPALLRPGRIDKHVYLDYPTEDERADLLQIYSHAITFEQPTEEIVKKTANYSYSDLVGLLKELRIKKAGVLLKQPHYEKSDFKVISKAFFDEIQKGYRLSATPQQQTQQRRRYEAFAKGENDSLEHQRTALK